MIEIINQQNRYRINPDTFHNLLEKLIDFYKVKSPEITLAFINNAPMKRLNEKYLNKNMPTDVLSFPLNEKGADDKFYLGDIIISAPYAFKQSASKDHGFERELEILTVHGFLHLLGFEHFKGMEGEEKKIHKLLFKEQNGH
jgi:probable rRNA maturation factor